MISRINLATLTVAVALRLTSCISVDSGASKNQILSEMRAVRLIGAINTAQSMEFARSGRYAKTLRELSVNADRAPGYKFDLQLTGDGYAIHASPTRYAVTGRRNFYSDQTTVIRQNFGPQPATHASHELRR